MKLTDLSVKSNRMGGVVAIGTLDATTSSNACIGQASGRKLSSGPGIIVGRNSSINLGRYYLLRRFHSISSAGPLSSLLGSSGRLAK